ncbi:hypothetical protein [Bermanella sp. R86510]|uniref:hypothetical protein n=1 Tax=unclassified Bermanella TaxID=2627862 RepID=UPI0037CC789B
MSKQQIYNRIASATIKALREQAEQGKVNSQTTDTVYQAIDEAFQAEYAQLIKLNKTYKDQLETIASGEIDKEAMVKLAQESLNS